MTTVYVVSTGDYSDWRIASICTTPEKAERVRDAFGSENPVDEYVLDDYADPIDQGLSCWKLIMCRDGSTVWCKKTEPDGKLPIWDLREWQGLRSNRVGTRLSAAMWARDEQHAVKIANEKRTQLIALGEWEPD